MPRGTQRSHMFAWAYDWDWPGAEASIRRALELAPGNADVVLAAALMAGNLGRLDESIALCRQGIALDPLNVHAHRYLGLYSLFAGFLEQAEAALTAAFELNPLGGMTNSGLGNIYLAQGRFPEALAAFEKESHEGLRLLGLAAAYHALGQKALVVRRARATERTSDARLFERPR